MTRWVVCISTANDQIELDYDIDEEDEDFDDSMSMASGMSGMSGMSRMSSASHLSSASLFSSSSQAPPLVSREDFDAIMDDFLDNYEVVGNKFRQALGGAALSGAEKLKVLRMAVEDDEDGIGKDENRRRILEIERMGRGVRAPREKRERVRREEDEGEKWDVETILSELGLCMVLAVCGILDVDFGGSPRIHLWGSACTGSFQVQI